MSLFAQLLDPRILATLDERDIDALEAIVESEIAANPQIQEALKARVEPLAKTIEERGPTGRVGRGTDPSWGKR